MRVGTKSVLFGAHCFFLHPWFVAAAWWKLFGFPWDPRLWVAFFVHDLGCFGKPNMDGPEGEEHPRLGAAVMHILFDRREWSTITPPASWPSWPGGSARVSRPTWKWHNFALYHSRFLAKRDGARPSRLCIADKLAIALTPAWLYLPMANATGELAEYRKLSEQKEKSAKYSSMHLPGEDARKWYAAMQTYILGWVGEHRDGREDTWTPEQGKRESVDSAGTWR